MSGVKNFTDLFVWQKAHFFVVEVYLVTQNFPKSEMYGLTQQLRKSAVSVVSNIAEGFGRRSWKEKLHFYNIARASLTEAQSQILIARDIKYILEAEAESLLAKSEETYKLLNSLMKLTNKGY